MEFSDLPVGEEVRLRLQAATRRLSHAYILSGPEGGGKRELADTLAAAYVCSGPGERPCGQCRNCRKARGHIHPDVLRLAIAQDRRGILVDQIRGLREQVYLRPNEAERKVFVIEDAQTMNPSAQNALLKVLEDGPAYACFLLLTENPQQLLPTIRSRCEILSVVGPAGAQPLPEKKVQKMAGELTALLTGEDELGRMEYLAKLENKKLDRDALAALLSAVEEQLREQLPRRPGRILPLLELLRRVRLALPSNVGTGHLLGALAAGAQRNGGEP